MSDVTTLPHWLDDGSRLYTKNAARSPWLTDDQYYTGGNVVATPDWALGWNTAQTVDALFLGLPAAQNVFVIAERADIAFDFAHGAQTHPTAFIHTANQSTTEFSRWNAGGMMFGFGIAVTATEYSIGRDADGTNQLHSNVPTGATFEWSVNDAAELILSATTLTLQGNTITGIGSALTGTANTALTLSIPNQGANNNVAVGMVIQTDTGGTAAGSGKAGGSLSLTTGNAGGDTTAATGGDVIFTLGTGVATGRQGVLRMAGANDGVRWKMQGTGVFRVEDSASTNAVTIDHNGIAGLITAGGDILNIVDTTSTNGFAFTPSAAGINQILTTTSAGDATLSLQNQTMTPGASHNAVEIPVTWNAENFNHTSCRVLARQEGANTETLRGMLIDIEKGTGATVLTKGVGFTITSPTVAGTITNTFGFEILDQNVAGITTPRALRIAGTGAANAIVWGDSALQYANAAQNIRFADSTNARGIDFTLTAAGVQTIGTTAGNLTLSPTSANVATAANVDLDMSAGGRLFGGGVQVNSQTLAANTNLTMDENDGHIVITTGAVSVNTVTLPAASGNEGMIVSFYVTTDGGQNANIVRAGADVIQNGSADLANTQVALDDAGDYLMLECVSSTMWQVVVNSGGVVT